MNFPICTWIYRPRSLSLSKICVKNSTQSGISFRGTRYFYSKAEIRGACSSPITLILNKGDPPEFVRFITILNTNELVKKFKCNRPRLAVLAVLINLSAVRIDNL